MVKSSLDALAETEAIEVVWHSYELRPKGLPPIDPEQEQVYRSKIEAAWPQTKQIAKENYGVDMEYHRWGVETRLAHEGAKYAEAQGFGEAYHNAMFKAHFIDDNDFGDLSVLADIAADIGLDREAFVAAIESGEYSEEVDRDVTLARQFGLRGVPATIIEGKYLISGAQPLEGWQDIVRQVKEKQNDT